MNESCQPPPDLSFPCRHLRSNSMYYLSPADQDNDSWSSGVYRCDKTNETFGPDGEPVSKTDCCTGRKCYLS